MRDPERLQLHPSRLLAVAMILIMLVLCANGQDVRPLLSISSAQTDGDEQDTYVTVLWIVPASNAVTLFYSPDLTGVWFEQESCTNFDAQDITNSLVALNPQGNAFFKPAINFFGPPVWPSPDPPTNVTASVQAAPELFLAVSASLCSGNSSEPCSESHATAVRRVLRSPKDCGSRDARMKRRRI